MTIPVYKSDGTLLSNLADRAINSTLTSLSLIGKYAPYGQAVNENFLHLLENFASPNEPINPIIGQLWFHTYESQGAGQPLLNVFKMKVFNGSEWILISGGSRGSVPPASPELGDLWYNTVDNQLYYFGKQPSGVNGWIRISTPGGSENPPVAPSGSTLTDGTFWWMLPERMLWMYDSTRSTPFPEFVRIGGTNNGQNLTGGWVLIGPSTPSNSGTYFSYSNIVGTASNPGPHSVMKIYINNKLIGVFSSSEFEPLSPIDNDFYIQGFDSNNDPINVNKIYPGLNLNYNQDSVFTGESSNSSLLDGVDSSAFIGRGIGADPDQVGNPINGSSKIKTYPFGNKNVDLGRPQNRWNILYADKIYAGNSVDSSNIDTSSVNLYGKAKTAENCETADKLTQPFNFNTVGTNNLYDSGTAPHMAFTSSISIDGSEDVSGTLSFTSNGKDVIEDIAQDVVDTALGGSNSIFIKRDGTSTGFGGNLGSDNDKFTTIFAETFNGTAIRALYSEANGADLAERYHADKPYEFGTIVKIGGDKEITETTIAFDNQVFGVVSKNPGYLMNAVAGNDSTHPAIAKIGRVPAKVVGVVKKGQRLVSSNIPGTAMALDVPFVNEHIFCVIGRSLQDKDDDGLGLIEIVIG